MLLGPEIPLAAGMLRHVAAVAAGHLWCHCSEGRVAELRWVLMLAAAPGGTKNGQVSKTDTSEPFKRLGLSMCCAIRYLNCLLA